MHFASADMTALVFFNRSEALAQQRHAELLAAGVVSPGLLQCNKLVHDVTQGAPDQVILHLDSLDELTTDDALTAQLSGAHLRCPVLLWLEQAPPPLLLAAALACGVQDLLLGDVAPEQLVLTLALAQARWKQQQADQEAAQQRFNQAQAQLSERKWVERAKGVLMQAQGMGEDEAFRLLRGTAMHAKMQVGEVSRSVIEAAQWAEAMNRSGQLRMLSQRLLKLAVQRHVGIDAKRASELQLDAAQRIEENLAFLVAVHDNTATSGGPLAASIGPSLQGVQEAWRLLRSALGRDSQKTVKVTAAGLGLMDDRAEALLQSSEALTKALASTSGRVGLNVVNLCGRQRMRVQRLAKQALLASLLPERAMPDWTQIVQDFEQSLHELDAAPLSSAEIRALLVVAREQWLHLVHALRGQSHADARATLCGTSESLLETFDRLTACYEHSLQVILG